MEVCEMLVFQMILLTHQQWVAHVNQMRMSLFSSGFCLFIKFDTDLIWWMMNIILCIWSANKTARRKWLNENSKLAKTQHHSLMISKQTKLNTSIHIHIKPHLLDVTSVGNFKMHEITMKLRKKKFGNTECTQKIFLVLKSWSDSRENSWESHERGRKMDRESSHFDTFYFSAFSEFSIQKQWETYKRIGKDFNWRKDFSCELPLG